MGNMAFHREKTLRKAKARKSPLRGNICFVCLGAYFQVVNIVISEASQAYLIENFLAVNRISAEVNGNIDLGGGNIAVFVNSARDINIGVTAFWGKKKILFPVQNKADRFLR